MSVVAEMSPFYHFAIVLLVTVGDCLNCWLRGIKTYRFPWYLRLVSTNHALSNPGQVNNQT